ncbi:MAG: hypothetical protein KC416_11835 [Myxococcales bacterium]|nr:hypothetical protein [Myxococcales bacterium]
MPEARLRPKIVRMLTDLAREEPVALGVSGRCMEPAIESGSVVSIEGQTVYFPGDVVAVRLPDGRVVLHRFLGYRPLGARLGVVTCADNARIPDAAAPASSVIGKVKGSRPTPRERAAAASSYALFAAAYLRRRTFGR